MAIFSLFVRTARPLRLLSRANGDSRPHPAENSIRTENPELQVLSSAVKGPLSNVRTPSALIANLRQFVRCKSQALGLEFEFGFRP